MDIAIGNLARHDDNGIQTLSASISVDTQVHDVSYRCRYGPIAGGADTFLIASLLPAMKCGTTIHSPWPISSRLRRSLPTIQDIFSVWEGRLRKIALDVPVLEPPTPSTAKGVGAFFSGGVDSFYTVLKHPDEITALIFVHGFDVPLDDRILRAKVSDGVRRAADGLGKPLIEVETNLRSFSDRFLIWDLYYGSALASVATLLSPQLHKVYIPSSHSYAHLYPVGSHVLVDPMWSTEVTEIVHDGAEVTRVEKVRRIALNTVVLDHLRVCFENRGGEYNCGRCEKCLRTMVSLYVVGALEDCKTFTEPMRLAAVARVRMNSVHTRAFTEDNLSAAEIWAKDPSLTRALRDSLCGRYYRGGWRLLSNARRLPRQLVRAAVPARWRAYVRSRWERTVGRQGLEVGRSQ